MNWILVVLIIKEQLFFDLPKSKNYFCRSIELEKLITSAKKIFWKSTQKSTFFSILTIFHHKTLYLFLTPLNILFLRDFFLNWSTKKSLRRFWLAFFDWPLLSAQVDKWPKNGFFKITKQNVVPLIANPWATPRVGLTKIIVIFEQKNLLINHKKYCLFQWYHLTTPDRISDPFESNDLTKKNFFSNCDYFELGTIWPTLLSWIFVVFELSSYTIS